jgi:hypothetical protein
MSTHRQHYPTVSEPKILTPLNLLGAFLIAMVLGTAHLLDPEMVPDHSAEWSTSHGMKDAQAVEDAEQVFQREAQVLCNTVRGPNSEVRWLPDGSMVCTVRRGVVKAGVQL